MKSELEQLRSGIDALEAQREGLGDLVVELSVAALRRRLDALVATQPGASAAAALAQKLKQVTILFLDVVGSTTLSQRLDPEEISAVMDGALARGTAIVGKHGGKVLQYAGDNLLAVFGADEAREDDPERAVCCGLALLAEGRALGEEVERQYAHPGFNVRIGVHTGGVLLGGGVDADGTIRGIAVNIAARMEQTAPAGGMRISHDTWHLVRGAFDVEAQAPLAVKGVAEPVVTYLVIRTKPRSLRTGTRGIEGIETRMVGRDAEMKSLQEACARLHDERRYAAVTVVADAGVGKSRLLHEFERWLADQPQPLVRFHGRADPATQSRPFGLLRDVLAWHLQIGDSDSMRSAKDKIEQGLVPLFVADDGADLAQAHAHLLGHLIGLDFGDSRHVKGILDDPKQIRTRAFHAAAQVLRRVAARAASPLLLQLDDPHWADDGSLEFLSHLAQVNRDVPMLVLGLARPTLFERRSDWADGDAQCRIDLVALDKSHSQQLADELLKKLPEVPAALSELIIGRAEGNPFYMEELVQMLVDQGALETGAEQWTLHPARLLATPVPATLTGVLQARLDGLPPPERLALQEASVIGLVFWDQALEALDPDAVQALPALVRRELALPHKEASFDDLREYAFRHQILHQVTYDTLLKRARQALHAKAAAWMTALTGARAGDFLGATAEHHEKAGNIASACEFFTRAAEQARKRYAHEAALAYVGRALALGNVGADNAMLLLRWRLLDVRERTLELQGRRPEQRADLDAMQQLADALDDDARRAEIAARRSLLAGRTGDYRGQESSARQAMLLATRASDHETRLNAQRLLADALTRLGDAKTGHTLVREGLAEARLRGLRGLEGRFLNALTVLAGRADDLLGILDSSRQAIEIRRSLGDRRNEAIGLSSLGVGWLELGQFEQARRHLEEALRLHSAVGDRALEPIVRANLSQLALWQGDPSEARDQALAALAIAQEVQSQILEVLALWSLGHAELGAGRQGEAAAAFERAHAIAVEHGSPLQHDATAGRACVALAMDDVPQALAFVEALLAHLDSGGTLEGCLTTGLIQLSCCRALARAQHPRMSQVLAGAHAALNERAATISDPALRQSFLKQVPHNRELIAAWEQTVAAV